MPNNEKVIEGLNGLLADATVFYQKLRHYHWNVVGRDFFMLHEKFEELYTGWASAIDELAERILMVGGVPLHTLESVLRQARIQEEEGIPVAQEMVASTVADLQALRGALAEVIEAAEAAEDRGTVNLLDGLADGIEKHIWMLSAWKKEAAKSWN
jgi:starvation-inducible DNA-binding protein